MKYRILRRYSGFFSHWFYTLEKQNTYWFFGQRARWEWRAGNELTESIPETWKKLNAEITTEEI